MTSITYGRIYKGEDYIISIPVNFAKADVSDFELKFYTDGDNVVEIPLSGLTVSGSIGTVYFNEMDFSLLNDGVLYYTMKYKIGNSDYVINTNTMHYLKTPANYSGKTSQDIWASGYTSGYTDGSASAGIPYYNSGYTSGYTDGEAAQKAKLTTITITQNGTVTRADGYSTVVVNVASGHSQEEINAAFSSGYTSGATAQKALLVSTAITENGTYNREDGYNSITVNVTGTTPTGTRTIMNDGTFDVANYANVNVNTGIAHYRSIANFYKGSARKLYIDVKKVPDGILPNNADSITFTNNVEEIGEEAFMDCICNFNLPNSLKIIGNGAFLGNYFDEITIPSGVTTIGNTVFMDCENLTGVTFTSINPPTIGGDCFDGCNENLVLYVPNQSVQQYKTMWPEYASLIQGY